MLFVRVHTKNVDHTERAIIIIVACVYAYIHRLLSKPNVTNDPVCVSSHFHSLRCIYNFHKAEHILTQFQTNIYVRSTHLLNNCKIAHFYEKREKTQIAQCSAFRMLSMSQDYRCRDHQLGKINR